MYSLGTMATDVGVGLFLYSTLKPLQWIGNFKLFLMLTKKVLGSSFGQPDWSSSCPNSEELLNFFELAEAAGKGLAQSTPQTSPHQQGSGP